jgi:hypothetical protein
VVQAYLDELEIVSTNGGTASMPMWTVRVRHVPSGLVASAESYQKPRAIAEALDKLKAILEPEPVQVRLAPQPWRPYE